ncbi:arginine/serine-rich protein 1 [Aplochiton taeniatus]
MKTEEKSLYELAHICQNEGISLVFDQDTLSSSASRSRSRSISSYGGSNSSGSSRQLKGPRPRHYRSASSSSSSSAEGHSTSRARSRSHPRCHRMSSRCRCCKQARYGYRHRDHRSPRRHNRAHPNISSPAPDRSHRSRSSRLPIDKKGNKQTRCMLSRSPPRRMKTHRSHPRSSERSNISRSLEEKKQLLMAAKADAGKELGGKQLELPESVEAILIERPVETSLTPQANPEPEERVRPEPVPEKNQTQNSWTEAHEDSPILNTSPLRKIICFSINNSVAKPTGVAPSTRAVSNAPVRVDSFTSKRPYGHWVPVRKTGQTSHHRKHRLTTSR